MPKLLITTDAQGELTHDITGDTVTIGRSSDNTIQIKDASVSQHHARLSLRAGIYVLEDLGSTNKSFHNAVPVMEKELESSCILSFGTVEAIYKVLPTDRPGAATRDGQLERQIETLRQARDLANHRNLKLSKERDALSTAHDEAKAELENLRKRLEALEKGGSPQPIGSPANAPGAAGGDGKSKESESARCKELQRDLSAAERERDAIRKQVEQVRAERDQLQDRNQKAAQDLHEAKDRIDALAKRNEAAAGASAKELEQKVEEQRKQILSLLAAQRENETARAAAEDKLATLDKAGSAADEEIRKRLDEAEKAAAESEAAHRKAVDLVTKERDDARAAASETDALRKQLETLTAEGESLRGELNAQRDASDRAGEERNEKFSEVSAQLEKARLDLEQVAKEKDALAAERDRLKETSASGLDELRNSLNAASEERDAALREREAVAAELEEARKNADAGRESAMAEVRAELERARTESSETVEDRNAIRLQKEMLSDELAKAHEEVAAAKTERSSAAAERDKAIAEMEAERATREAVSAELAEANAQNAAQQTLKADNEQLATQLTLLRMEFDALKNHTGELLARISNGGDPNDAVDAFTDRIPDLKRYVGANFRRAEVDDLDDEIFTPDPPAKPTSDGPVIVSEKVGNWLGKKHNAARSPAPAPSVSGTTEVEETDRSNIGKIPDLLAQMRRDLQYLIRHKNDKEIQHKLCETARSISEKTGSTQFLALHEMARALENLIRSLHESPERVEQSTLRTVSQSIDFLGVLLEPANLDRTRTMGPAHVLAVDDDAEVLDSVLGAMELVNLESTGVEESAHCLDTMEKQHYDLLLLDVRLSEITGWDVCTRIREMPGHRKTPILFLTGMATIENKAQSMFRGANDFIAKPFNVCELGIKSLMWVYRGKLELL